MWLSLIYCLRFSEFLEFVDSCFSTNLEKTGHCFFELFFFYPILSPLLGDSDHKYIGWTDIVAQIINTFFFSVSLSFVLDNVCWNVFKFTVLQYSLCCEMSSLFQILDFYFRYRSRLSVAFVITISLLRFLIQPFIFNH